MKASELNAGLRQPSGEFSFRFTPNEPLQGQTPGKSIWHRQVGAILWVLETGAPGTIRAYRASPGTGTRMSVADVKHLGNPSHIRFGFRWGPRELQLIVSDDDHPERVAAGREEPPDRRFQIDKHGGVNVVHASVSRFEMSIEGTTVLRASAIDAWCEIVRGVNLLLEARLDDPDFAILAPNLSISTLVTGWETYGKRRFVELPTEGVQPREEDLISAFFSAREREAGVPEEMQRKTKAPSIALALVEANRISFQSYEQFKRAFSKGYKLSLGSLGIPSDVLRSVKRCIEYRHRITHVSPFLMVLNGDRVPPEEPEGGNHDFAYAQVAAFDRAIKGLHEATLRLKRT